ncbi:hypothetical protein D3C76_1005400 [compost metagenome]
MTRQAVQAQGREQNQETVDLPSAQDAVGLVGRQVQQRCDAPDALGPQPTAKVVDHCRHRYRRKQPWNIQRDVGHAGEPDEERHRPHEDGRLVAVDLTGTVRDQP